jgi:hypothetical protein
MDGEIHPVQATLTFTDVGQVTVRYRDEIRGCA